MMIETANMSATGFLHEKSVGKALGKSPKVLVERIRPWFARGSALLVLVLVLFTDHGFPQGGWLDVTCEIAGFGLLMACVFGRVWSLLYISGHKNSIVVDAGPYSLVRHPLYVSTFLGSLGFGLASENLVALAIIIVLSVVAYFPVVRAEEIKLTKRHGDDYRDYVKRVPQLIPRLRGLSEPESWVVYPRVFRKASFEAIATMSAFILFQGIEGLHNAGVLPVLVRFG